MRDLTYRQVLSSPFYLGPWQGFRNWSRVYVCVCGQARQNPAWKSAGRNKRSSSGRLASRGALPICAMMRRAGLACDCGGRSFVGQEVVSLDRRYKQVEITACEGNANGPKQNTPPRRQMRGFGRSCLRDMRPKGRGLLPSEGRGRPFLVSRVDVEKRASDRQDGKERSANVGRRNCHPGGEEPLLRSLLLAGFSGRSGASSSGEHRTRGFGRGTQQALPG